MFVYLFVLFGMDVVVCVRWRWLYTEDNNNKQNGGDYNDNKSKESPLMTFDHNKPSTLKFLNKIL